MWLEPRASAESDNEVVEPRRQSLRHGQDHLILQIAHRHFLPCDEWVLVAGKHCQGLTPEFVLHQVFVGARKAHQAEVGVSRQDGADDLGSPQLVGGDQKVRCTGFELLEE